MVTQGFTSYTPSKRAQRRFKELLDKGEKVTFEEVPANVTGRDKIDSTRKISPLKKAEDAIEIDNSDLGLEDQFNKIYNYAKETIEKAQR